MAYQSKTYSLSDEVVAAIEMARRDGLSPNKFLRQLVGLDPMKAIASDVVRLTKTMPRAKTTAKNGKGRR